MTVIPETVPEDFNTSHWPSEIPELVWDYEETAGRLWRLDRSIYDEYVRCLDALCDAFMRNRTGRFEHAKRHRRRLAHQMLCRHYGVLGSDSEIEVVSESSASVDDSDVVQSCPADLMRRLVSAARGIDPQPSDRESAIWASERMTLVRVSGWDSVFPSDVIGMFALEMLLLAVEDPHRFMKDIYPTYVVKQKKDRSSDDGFVDDGREIVDYARRLHSLKEEISGGG